jgi:DNA-binding NarL/FixJ family response regulator
MGNISILLADDHKVLREGLELLLSAEPDIEVIGQATDGKEAYQMARELRPDVVIMDISMPGMSGTQATESLRATCPEVKVLALTAHEDADYMRQLLKAGASGYLLKSVAMIDLAHAIRVVAAGGVYLDPALAGKVMSSYLRKSQWEDTETSDETAASSLSEREVEVLRLVAWGHTNKEIAAQLHLGVKTIETHKAHAMEKLNFQNRADVVRYALRRGWLEEA